MKYLKTLGLAAVAAMAVLAFVGAGTASATVLCESHVEEAVACPTKWANGSTMEFSLKAGTSASLRTSGGSLIDTCTGSSVKGIVTTAGSSTTTAAGSVAKADLTWSGCTWTTDTVTGGTLEVHYVNTNEATVTAKDVAVTINTFGSCIYGANAGLDLGKLTHNAANRQDNTLDINTTVSLATGHVSGGLCPEKAIWQGEYTQTTKTNLFISKS